MSKFCSICTLDGNENIPAVAQYTDNMMVSHYVCKRHLEDVKQANLEYKEFTDEEIQKSEEDSDAADKPFYEAESCEECGATASEQTWDTSQRIYECDACGAVQ